MNPSANIAYASVDSFVSNVNTIIINPLIVLLFALALAYFAYGVFEFLMNQQNDEKRSIGKNHMIWGIVGMLIMFGVFFLMNLLIDSFNLERGGTIDPELGTVDLNEYNPPSYP